MPDSATHTPETESLPLVNAITQPGMETLQAVEQGVSTVGGELWKFFHQLPYHGAGVGFGVGLGAAMLVGVPELVTACFAAYVSYRIFAYGESLCDAIEKTIKFEGGTLPDAEIEKP